MRNWFYIFLFSLCAMSAGAQSIVSINKPHHYSFMPKGNYSGIVHIGGDRFAMVDDKAGTDGFVVLTIRFDSITGDISHISYDGYRSSKLPNRDMEGISYLPQLNQVIISGEADNRIWRYDTLGHRLTQPFDKPKIFEKLPGNYGLESLTYNEKTGLVWTCNENLNDTVYLQSYTPDGKPARCYRYPLDAPEAKAPGSPYAHGVSELCALDDGKLLVLEREVYVAKQKIGSWVRCKLYVTDLTHKHLLTQWKTRINLTHQDFANYEGMCLAGQLSGGRKILLLVSDSQNQYGGILKDWFRTIVIQP